ncbi:MAG: hypothetical protein GY749_33375 [Desulfobacteraceae bacterium]|nr:hypothetical protein [Desulfobacteraceae bacterium]
MNRYKIYSSVPTIILATILVLSVMHRNILAEPVMNKNNHADRLEYHRMLMGLEGFAALLNADMDIRSKTNNGRLILVLIYEDVKQQKAEKLALYLKKIKTVRKIPVQIDLINDTEMKGYKNKKTAGIFLLRKLGAELESVIQYGIKNSVIVYSPYEGDVENGVSAGLLISDKISPYVNMNTMKSSGIRIKPFFLKKTKQYK